MLYRYTIKGQSILSQYSGLDFSGNSIITARYKESIIEEYAGNPLIEALPPLRDKQKTIVDSERPLHYDENVNSRMSIQERLDSAERLRFVRFTLPFYYSVEQQIHGALCRAYKLKHIVDCRDDEISVTFKGKAAIVTGKSYGLVEDTSPTGFCLFGYSGCGKSCAINTITDYFPQVIIHDIGGIKLIQIVYLMVVCRKIDNIGRLYDSIAKAIDRALHNTKPHYGLEVLNMSSLEEKEEKIIELIDTFNIGLILIDEIQNMTFQDSRRGSFSNLLHITNETKVGLALIGTEESLEAIIPNPQIFRRVGHRIDASRYCKNKAFIQTLIEALFHYQWLEHPIVLTKEIVDILFEESHGIIFYLIEIYIAILQYCMMCKTEPQLTQKIIRSICRETLSRLDIVLNDKNLFYTYEEAIFNDRVDDYNLQNIMTANISHTMKKEELRKEVISIIQCVTNDYNEDSIAAIFDAIYEKKKEKGIQITSDVFQLLTNSTSDKRVRPKKKKVSNSQEILQEFMDSQQ